MNDPDVVKELDHWIEETLVGEVFRALLHRARDEIVRLRAHYPVVANHYIEQARIEALEEAAQVCEGPYTTGSTGGTLKAIADAIRALK